MSGVPERLHQAATVARSGGYPLPVGLDDTLADLLDTIAMRAEIVPDSVIERALAVAEVLLDDEEGDEHG